MQPMVMVGVTEGACRRINVASVVDSVIGLFSARREVARADDVEDVEDEEEEEAVVVEAKDQEVRFSLLLWLSRGQRRLGVRCNSPLTLPQCPVAETRETSLALSWPARISCRGSRKVRGVMTHGPQVDAVEDSRQKIKRNKDGNMKIGKRHWRPGRKGETGPGRRGAVVHACT